jgi:hypothetical protein
MKQLLSLSYQGYLDSLKIPSEWSFTAAKEIYEVIKEQGLEDQLTCDKLQSGTIFLEVELDSKLADDITFYVTDKEAYYLLSENLRCIEGALPTEPQLLREAVVEKFKAIKGLL